MLNNIGNSFKPKYTSNASLSVFYNNDMHGDLKRLGKLKTAKDCFEKQNVTVPKLTLSGGDMFLGTDKKRNSFLVEFMNKFKLDATTLGNHEFSAKSKGLAENLEKAEFKTVCANIEVDDKNDLVNRLKDKKLVKSATFMKGGHKFGIIGAAPIDSYIGKNEVGENPTKVMDIDKTIKAINEEAKNLESQGVNKIILCSHVGYGDDKDLRIAKETEGVDIIIGGHTHTVIDGVNTEDKGENEKLNLVMSKRNEPVLITQAGGLNKYAGYLNVEFDEKGVLKQDKIINKLVNLDGFEDSKSVETIMEKYLGKNETLATIKGSYNPKNPTEERLLENPIHSHFGKALLEKFKDEGAEVAVFGAPTLRGGANEKITTYDIKYAMLPFNTEIGIVDMTEKDLVKVLNANWDKYQPKAVIPDLCRASGMSFSASTQPKLNAEGEKVYIDDIKLDDNTIINALNPSDKKIKVVIDKYTLMTKLPEKLEEFNATSTEQEAMIDYLKNKQEISLENENKFVYKG